MIISIHLIIQTNKASAWNLVQTSHRHASYFGYWDPRPHILSKSELNIHSSFTRRFIAIREASDKSSMNIGIRGVSLHHAPPVKITYIWKLDPRTVRMCKVV